MPDRCEMCEQAERRDAGEDPFAIARLSTGFVTLALTKSAADVDFVPHGYQKPFISWPKLMAMGRWR